MPPRASPGSGLVRDVDSVPLWSSRWMMKAVRGLTAVKLFRQKITFSGDFLSCSKTNAHPLSVAKQFEPVSGGLPCAEVFFFVAFFRVNFFFYCLSQMSQIAPL